ncbi:hypothetical protein BU15DRAFT_64853 [Melanogaster broomeanus]|nr:hypothetical protein BU15DRAFT_64853 [Melanogaster broomeanus]
MTMTAGAGPGVVRIRMFSKSTTGFKFSRCRSVPKEGRWDAFCSRNLNVRLQNPLWSIPPKVLGDVKVFSQQRGLMIILPQLRNGALLARTGGCDTGEDVFPENEKRTWLRRSPTNGGRSIPLEVNVQPDDPRKLQKTEFRVVSNCLRARIPLKFTKAPTSNQGGNTSLLEHDLGANL